ncbi:MAG TPA: hypothetical protein DCM68_01770 [Verrucomicrobia bacterium]|nr:hypothetical protein [Verrucomicrobiota bacterium]
MSLQVNLILEPERRSASLIRFKTIGQIAVAVAVTVLTASLAWKYLGYLEVRRALQQLEPQRMEFEQRQKETDVLQQALNLHKGYLDEIMGWHHSRLPWEDILEGIRTHVPDTMQWRTLQLRMQLAVGKDGHYAREHAVTLNGRHQGANAEARVESFRRAWETEAPMSDWTDKAVVASFTDDDTPGATSQDRLFQIEVSFKPRSFRAPAGQ